MKSKNGAVDYIWPSIVTAYFFIWALTTNRNVVNYYLYTCSVSVFMCISTISQLHILICHRNFMHAPKIILRQIYKTQMEIIIQWKFK